MQTRRIALTVTIIFLLGSLFILGFSPKALAHDNDTELQKTRCSLHLLHGKFIYGGQGFTLFAPPTLVPPFDLVSAYTPFALAGTVTFDGNGNLTSFDFANLGPGGFGRTGAGTYAVDTTNPGFCGFSATWTFTSSPPNGLPPITTHFYMVPRSLSEYSLFESFVILCGA